MGVMISSSVLAIHWGVSGGLCGLFFQTQVFLIILLGIFFLKEKPALNNWIGMSIGFLGIFLIALQIKGNVPLGGILIILLGAFAIACVSIILRRIKEEKMTSLMVWSSLGACPPVLALTEFLHGHEKALEIILQFSHRSIFSILYMSLGAGILGNTLWGLLLKKYPVALVAPFALLIPVLSILFSYIFFGETLNSISLFGTVLIIGGLVINELKFRPKSL
jgi:O-acetylserine/cysteine efflux transporter